MLVAWMVPAVGSPGRDPSGCWPAACRVQECEPWTWTPRGTLWNERQPSTCRRSQPRCGGLEDIERLSATVARELPADFVASLRRHDGQDNPTRFLDLIDHYTLLGVEDGDGIWLDDD